MRLLLLLVIFLCVLTAPLGAAHVDRSGPVRVGIFPLKPINFIDAEGNAQGLYPDLIRGIVAAEGLTVEFVPGTWAQGLERLQSGEIDLMTTIARTAEREKMMDFNTEAVANIWGQVFLRPGSGIENIADLENIKVGIADRDINGQNFIKTVANLGIDCEISRFPTHADILSALKNREIDAGVTPSYFGLRHATEYNLVPSSIQFSPFSIFFAVKKGQSPHLLNHIDDHLREWKVDPESYYYQRLNYWMGGQGEEKAFIPLWLRVSLVLVVMAALFFFILSLAFKAQVRKTTRKLRNREREYRHLVQGINGIVLRVDTRGTILFINRYGLDFFGFDRDEIVGKNVMETIVPAQETDGRDLQPMVEDILNHLVGHETVENENICKDGRRVYIQWRNQPEYDEEGEIIGVFSVGADISERFRDDAELRSKEEKFRTLFEHVADYALVLQPRGDDLVIIDLSETACRQHGYRREELVGQPISLLDTEPVSVDDSRVGRLAAGETLRFEVTHRRKDGSTFPVEVVTKLIEIDGEQVIFSIERDLTLRKKAESEKNELEKELRQKFKMEAIGTLAGGIAHDFNNILAIILGTAQLMLRKLPQGDSNAEKIERILAAANRAKHLVDQVLAFSRRQEPSLQPLWFVALVEDTLELLRASIPRTVNLEMKFAPGCEGLKVEADATQIQQVLINLCNNAVFAMQEKGTIEIGIEKIALPVDEFFSASQPAAGEYLQLSVTDSGGGIRADNLEKIFDPFYTTKQVGRGTGLGLSVVHGIVQGHRGLIRVHSQRGQGSRFEICLPLTEEPVRRPEEDTGPLPTGSERILFVDDEEDIGIWADELFKQQGFKPVCYSSSEDALEFFKRDPRAFDLLVTDQAMPALSGQELIEEVRKLRPDIPVILCTGFSSRVSAEIADRQGINKFFYKPYREQQLLTAIRDCLDNKAK